MNGCAFAGLEHLGAGPCSGLLSAWVLVADRSCVSVLCAAHVDATAPRMRGWEPGRAPAIGGR